jgi:hypothetical protein
MLTFQDIVYFIDPGSEDFQLIRPLLESIEDQEVEYFCLSSLGLIYWEAYLSQNRNVELKPHPTGERHGCRFRDDHYPLGFKTYVKKVYEQYPFITDCHSVPYTGQKGIQGKEFYIRSGKIYGHYVDKNKFGARFRINTTAGNALERQGAVNQLNKGLPVI